MYLESLNRLAVLALDANSTATAFSNPAPVTTAPTAGTGWRLVSNLALNPGVVPSRLRITPIGVGNDDTTFSIRVWALYRYLSSGGANFFWPQPILEIACTLGTFTGITGGVFTTSTRFADTISIVATVGEPKVVAGASVDGTAVTMSPANNTVAWVECPAYAALGHYFDFDMTGATSGNALVEFIN